MEIPQDFQFLVKSKHQSLTLANVLQRRSQCPAVAAKKNDFLEVTVTYWIWAGSLYKLKKKNVVMYV